MKIHRVVTGHSPDGKAVVASDEEIEAVRAELLPGVEYRRVWGTDAPPTYPDDGSPLNGPAHFAPVGGFRFIHIVVPPRT